MTEFAKSLRAVDLAIAAGRQRQSPRTGFVHLFHGDPAAKDTIPLYENACFALALFAERKAESVLEGRDLMLRLLEFQTPEGNFPTYLHDFPRAYDGFLGLKIGPLLLRMLSDYSSLLSAPVKQTLHAALQKILAFTETRRAQKPLPPLWEHRYQVLCSRTPAPLDTTHFSPADYWDYWISLQFLEIPQCAQVHSELGVYRGASHGEEQEGIESMPQCIEYVAAEAAGRFSPRLLKDHVRQLQLSVLKQVAVLPNNADFMRATDASEEHVLRLLWSGTNVHSLVLPKGSFSWVWENNALLIDLPPLAEVSRNDLFEIALYTDASPETTLFVEQNRATVFSVGDQISIVTPNKTVTVQFELVDGNATFCGHIFRGNRPCQTALSGAFDFQIALRTLRREGPCRLRIFVDCPAVDGHSHGMHPVVDVEHVPSDCGSGC